MNFEELDAYLLSKRKKGDRLL